MRKQDKRFTWAKETSLYVLTKILEVEVRLLGRSRDDLETDDLRSFPKESSASLLRKEIGKHIINLSLDLDHTLDDLINSYLVFGKIEDTGHGYYRLTKEGFTELKNLFYSREDAFDKAKELVSN